MTRITMFYSPKLPLHVPQNLENVPHQHSKCQGSQLLVAHRHHPHLWRCWRSPHPSVDGHVVACVVDGMGFVVECVIENKRRCDKQHKCSINQDRAGAAGKAKISGGDHSTNIISLTVGGFWIGGSLVWLVNKTEILGENTMVGLLFGARERLKSGSALSTWFKFLRLTKAINCQRSGRCDIYLSLSLH